MTVGNSPLACRAAWSPPWSRAMVASNRPALFLTCSRLSAYSSVTLRFSSAILVSLAPISTFCMAVVLSCAAARRSAQCTSHETEPPQSHQLLWTNSQGQGKEAALLAREDSSSAAASFAAASSKKSTQL